jgi:succinoglycan biosynthesis protein ExoA
VAALPLAAIDWMFAVPALVWALAALGYGVLIGVRRGEPAALASGLAAMIMHLGWSAGFWVQLMKNRPPSAPLGSAQPATAIP